VPAVQVIEAAAMSRAISMCWIWSRPTGTCACALNMRDVGRHVRVHEEIGDAGVRSTLVALFLSTEALWWRARG
jgi:hypothetical protein